MITPHSKLKNDFYAGKSTIDNIFCVIHITEKHGYKKTHLKFVHFTKACNNIIIVRLFHILEESPMNVTSINIIKELHKKNFTVRIRNMLTLCTRALTRDTVFLWVYLIFALIPPKHHGRGNKIPVSNLTLFYITLCWWSNWTITGFWKSEYVTRSLQEEYMKWYVSSNWN